MFADCIVRYAPALTVFDDGFDLPFAFNGPLGTDLRALHPLDQVAWRLEENLRAEINLSANDAWLCRTVADMAHAVGLQVRDVPRSWSAYHALTVNDLGDLELALQANSLRRVRKVLASWATFMDLI